MTSHEQIEADAMLAALYLNVLISQSVERADAVEITKVYVMSKVSQQTSRERDARDEQEQKKVKADPGMQRGVAGARTLFTGQHSRSVKVADGEIDADVMSLHGSDGHIIVDQSPSAE